MKKQTDFERKSLYLLRKMLEFPCTRHILAVLRHDGVEKATTHQQMTNILFAYFTENEDFDYRCCDRCCDIDRYGDRDRLNKLQDFTRKITNNLDIEIGLKLDKEDKNDIEYCTNMLIFKLINKTKEFMSIPY